MKKITVLTPIADVYGLYIALRQAYFDVGNIGSDRNGTYVYLADGEDKDPTSIVESWVDKVPEIVETKEHAAARKAQFDALPVPGSPPVAMLEVDGDHVLGLPDTEEAASPEPKVSALSKFFRRIF